MSKLTYTQAENVRRTTDNMIKLEVIDESDAKKVALALTRLIISDEEVKSNLREIAASIARTKQERVRVRNARLLLKKAKIRVS